MFYSRLPAILAVLCLVGCGSIAHISQPALDGNAKDRKIAIFLDGTHNDATTDTNVKRLHSLVSLQPNKEIASLYVEGVGVDTDLAGAALGWGTKARVKIAYEFLLNNYRPGDQIYIFGFSRGAYSARILTSLLNHAGLPKISDRTNAEIAEDVYVANKQDLDFSEEADRKKEVREALEATWKRSEIAHELKSVSVHFLGLWDTVEALGVPDYKSRLVHKSGHSPHFVDVDVRNRRYGDQLCNVQHAFQALAIDDNREWIFTPLLLTRTHLFSKCLKQWKDEAGLKITTDNDHIMQLDGTIRADRLGEVWFSGAHSDVGGGYADSRLSGVSLNWMLEVLKSVGSNLVPATSAVPQDPFGSSHDPESGWFKPLYHRMTRNIAGYMVNSDVADITASTDRPQINMSFGVLCVHPSVLQRRAVVSLRPHENDQLALRCEGKVRLARDTREDLSAPPRLWDGPSRQNMCAKPEEVVPCPTLEIRVWPGCNVPVKSSP